MGPARYSLIADIRGVLYEAIDFLDEVMVVRQP
jgi:hypothetical protein